MGYHAISAKNREEPPEKGHVNHADNCRRHFKEWNLIYRISADQTADGHCQMSKQGGQISVPGPSYFPSEENKKNTHGYPN